MLAGLEHLAVTGMTTDQLPIVLDAQLAPLVERLDFAAIGGLESLTRNNLHVSYAPCKIVNVCFIYLLMLIDACSM